MSPVRPFISNLNLWAYKTGALSSINNPIKKWICKEFVKRKWLAPHRHVSAEVFERVLKSVVLDVLSDRRVFHFRFFGERADDGEANAVKNFVALEQVGVH